MPSFGKAAAVVFVSETFRQEVCDKIRIPHSKTHVVYHGLSSLFQQKGETGDARFEPGYPFILSVSTINPHKNYDTLIRAFSRIIDSPDLSMYHLVIVGGIGRQSTYDMLVRLVAELDLVAKVHLLGEVEHGLLPAYYRAAEIFVLPSRLETFGNPLVEAMATGTPIVASNLPVCREICRDAAVYSDTEDHESLAKNMEDLLRNSPIRQQLAEKASKRSRAFSWDRAASKMIRIFEQVAGS
jgi:glycosyltransferase involved in cell wall biosynthesis